ncbi:hypothetical protein BP5796_13132 [Coleophoma crateriformis]|uniref:Uncharacterized protein n=1 Tax=Coleophoma crateriformis TaxID=565419 RepID=A0A3D8Q3N7_9HELO|nr:hypothetical protein BP5796_13132 [Coleophoma crateriformis]
MRRPGIARDPRAQIQQRGDFHKGTGAMLAWPKLALVVDEAEISHAGPHRGRGVQRFFDQGVFVVGGWSSVWDGDVNDRGLGEEGLAPWDALEGLDWIGDMLAVGRKRLRYGGLSCGGNGCNSRESDG